jgi:CRISPR type III-B/RAMP module-associated protein Cmr3
MSTVLFLRPDSPLVFRSGRPFGDATESGGADSYSFPMPGSVAGAVRAAWVDAVGHTHQAHDPTLAAITLRGPLLCTRSSTGAQLWLPPALDAVHLPAREPDGATLECLWPAKPAPGAGSDMPLGLCGVARNGKAPEKTDPPAFWAASLMASWLANYTSSAHPRLIRRALPMDTRTHVRIDSARQQGEQGGLFASAGLDFSTPSGDGEGADEHGLVVAVDAPADTLAGFATAEGRHFRLGADGRNAACLDITDHVSKQLACHPVLAAALAGVHVGDVVRLVLATPACYLRNGWYPDGLRPVQGAGGDETAQGELVGLPGWRFKLVAAAVGRFVAHAGIGMRDAAGKRARVVRPLQRMAPAGSVYWLEVLTKGSGTLGERWLQPTCYTEYARDGHGLGMFGLGLGHEDWLTVSEAPTA